MPPFLDQALLWARRVFLHTAFLFWWIWLAAVALTAVSESWWLEGRRRRLLERPDDGLATVWRAVQLGLLSPPSRRRIFGQARELLAEGVSRAGVLAYLVSAQSVLLWMLLFIVELDGPQPAVGQLVAVGGVLAVLCPAAARMPDRPWAEARRRARNALDREASAASPLLRTGPAWLRPLKSVAGQALSLWWPLTVGFLGAGLFLALGLSDAFVSLQGGKGPLVQAGNAVVGLVLAYVTGAPMIGNALVAAALWKAHFLTYAGLAAFYLGTLVMPFALPRYLEVFGGRLGMRILAWLAGAVLVGALAATAWWSGLHGLAGLLGLQDAFHALTDSTLAPNPVPWFHHWFAPGL